MSTARTRTSLAVRPAIRALSTLTEPEGPPVEEEGLSPGTAVGRYLVYDVLGAGGVGVVVNAYDSELDRRVAIKLLRSRQTGEAAGKAQARLLREAQAMARLGHPNVVAVHDVGTWRDRVFVAMELVEGGTLARWLDERRRPWREVVERFLAAGRGLAAAHAAGIVHRDFKPSNVMIGRDGRVQVTDFGLARSLQGGGDDEPVTPTPGTALSMPLTVLGTVLGTPGYMAPEQLRGEETDARTDQFAFCAALWEGLYRALPFDGQTAEEIAARVLAGELQEPPRDKKVPAHLRRLLARGLSLDPADRFPTMEELLAELARDPAAVRRHRVVSGLAVVALVSAAATLRPAPSRELPPCQGAQSRLAGVWDGGKRRAAEKAFLATGRPLAADSFARAARVLDLRAEDWAAMRTEACEATRIRGEQSAELLDLRMACLDARLGELGAVADAFASADAAVVDDAVKFAGSLGPLAECADARALTAPVKPPADPAARRKVAAIRAELSRGVGLYDVGRYRDAIALERPAAEAAAGLGWGPLEAEALLALADALEQNGQAAEAERTMARALWTAEAARHERIAAEAATKLVFILQDQAKIEDADRFLPLARALVERLGSDPVHRAELAGVTAILAERHGHYEESLRESERALALTVEAFGPESIPAARRQGALAGILLNMGHLEEAITRHRTALALWEKLEGPDHPDAGLALDALSAALGNAGRRDESRATARRALAVLERSLGPSHKRTAESRMGLAANLIADHRCDLARPQLARALRDIEQADGPDHPAVADALMGQAACDREEGHVDRALSSFQRARVIFEKKFGPDHPWLASPLGGIGSIELQRGRAAAALPLLERAVKLGAMNGEMPEELHDTEFDLARALWKLGKRERARLMAQASREGLAKLGPDAAERRAEVDRWLRAHRG